MKITSKSWIGSRRTEEHDDRTVISFTGTDPGEVISINQENGLIEIHAAHRMRIVPMAGNVVAIEPVGYSRSVTQPLPFSVDHLARDDRSGNRVPILGYFPTEEAATEYIGTVLANRDPDGVNDGAYGINGPAE